MNWAILIPLVPKLIEEIANLLAKEGPPTAEEWAALKSSTQVKGAAVMLQTLQEQGIDPNSDQGKAFMALVA